jgi:nitrite reductase (NO-forming)
LNQQRVRRLSAMTAVVAMATITLTACGNVATEVENHDVTRVPIMSDAAAQATREAALNPASPQAGEEGTPAAPPPAQPGAAQAAPIAIDAFDIYFEPKQVTIPANTDVSVSLPNKGVSAHNFSIDALGISVDLPPGETQSVTINAPAGTYEFYCDVPGHKEAGMVGQLIVSAEAATVASPAATPIAESATPSAQGATPVAASPAAGTSAPAAAATPSGAAPAAATAVDITAKDIFFEPKDVSIPANTDVTFKIVNEGAAAHNFSIDALKISVDLAPGETKEVVVNAPPGTYEFYCNVPGHKQAGMVGTLTVG